MIRFGTQRLLREVAPAVTVICLVSNSDGVSLSSRDQSVYLQEAYVNDTTVASIGSDGEEKTSSVKALTAHKLSFSAKNESSDIFSQWVADSGRLLFSKSNVQPDSKTNGTAPYLASLIRPTLEATCRAIRLMSTFVSIVFEYEVPELPKLFQPKIETNSDQSNDTMQQRLYWEKQVKYYTQQLQEAQKEYTKTSSQSDRSVQERKEAVHSSAQRLGEAEANFLLHGGKKRTHERAAQKLLQLCRNNGGVYIKVGQHLANLDYLIPYEYIDTLQELFDSAPVSSYESVRQVIMEELGRAPEELFDDFSVEPIASASLAQVHVAYDKVSGKKLAIKVQHRGLRETSRGDLFAVYCAVRAADFLFKDFTLGWLIDEILPQLPKELNFIIEGKNAERAAQQLRGSTDIVIPKVIWEKTTHRVLCMEFEEGFKCTDIQALDQAGLKKSDVSNLISSLFHSQVFLSGFVHSDPHPANVMVRKHPKKRGKPQLVLVDHGLYKEIDNDFRILYAHLYKSLLLADVPAIQATCEKLGITKMYTLLSAMLTSRPFDEIIERNKNGGLVLSTPQHKSGDAGDKAMIRGYAQTYFRDIIAMLDVVPRQMLLLFKMNDCLRHLDYALGVPSFNSLIISGRLAALAILKDEIQHGSSSLFKRLFRIAEHVHLLLRIKILELLHWWSTA